MTANWRAWRLGGYFHLVYICRCLPIKRLLSEKATLGLRDALLSALQGVFVASAGRTAGLKAGRLAGLCGKNIAATVRELNLGLSHPPSSARNSAVSNFSVYPFVSDFGFCASDLVAATPRNVLRFTFHASRLPHPGSSLDPPIFSQGTLIGDVPWSWDAFRRRAWWHPTLSP